MYERPTETSRAAGHLTSEASGRGQRNSWNSYIGTPYRGIGEEKTNTPSQSLPFFSPLSLSLLIVSAPFFLLSCAKRPQTGRDNSSHNTLQLFIDSWIIRERFNTTGSRHKVGNWAFGKPSHFRVQRNTVYPSLFSAPMSSNYCFAFKLTGEIWLNFHFSMPTCHVSTSPPHYLLRKKNDAPFSSICLN